MRTKFLSSELKQTFTLYLSRNILPATMVSTSRIKSVEFYRKIPRDLTEASLSGAGLSIIAAFAMMLLFGLELNNYLTISTTSTVVIDKSTDWEFLRIVFNISFPALSCEFATVDVNNVLGINRLNVTKTIRKYSIDPHLKDTGSEFQSVQMPAVIKHDEKDDEEYAEGAVVLNARNFDRIATNHQILAVNFYAPWCLWSTRLKPSWEKAAKLMRERYDPEKDGRILLGKVDCTEEADFCRSHHIQGYPSIRIFRRGTDVREENGQHEHESYYGDRDTVSLIKTMETLVAPVPLENKGTDEPKRRAPLTGGCRLEGFVRVKKVPGNLVFSVRSAAHSFDASQMNVSHVITHLSFGKKLSPWLMKDIRRLQPYLGKSHDRLDGQTYIIPNDDPNVTIEHYLQVVKTEVMTKSLKMIEEYEYTSHSSLVESVDIPVAKFHFELSPMQVIVTENPKSFSHFITNVCAIIGGIFTVAGIVDALLQSTMRMVKKVDLGKHF